MTIEEILTLIKVDAVKRAEEYLIGYYGSNDSRAYEQHHIDHYVQGFMRCTEGVIKRLYENPKKP